MRIDNGQGDMDPLHVYREFLRTSLHVRRTMRRLFTKFGLTGAQYGLLARIPEEGITLTQLAEMAWTDPGNTSTVIDRLVREGWVERTRSEQDRRVVTLRLSPQGKSRLAELTPLYQRAVEAFLSPLSPEEMALLLDLLSKLESGAGPEVIDGIVGEKNELTEKGVR